MDDNNILITLRCTVLGAAGHAFGPGKTITVEFAEQTVKFKDASGGAEQVWYEEIAELQILGPGKVTTGGGFIGGGLGVEGAAEGMLIAGVLNALTTRTKIHTVISMITNLGELHLHYAELEPSALRIAFAPVYTRLRRRDSIWTDGRMGRLRSLHERGIIDESRLRELSDRLQGKVGARLPEVRAANEDGTLDGPLGRCPMCSKKISLHASSCKNCGALFGPDAAWAPEPI